MQDVYKRVSEDFGNIFGDLLPGNTARLVPVNEQDLSQGLEVQVRLGAVWKLSLTELSGGQRSLIALSLIMSLLQYSPAPMYILDEIDSALDLSHTQNIGHLFRTRFKGSQFVRRCSSRRADSADRCVAQGGALHQRQRPLPHQVPRQHLGRVRARRRSQR